MLKHAIHACLIAALVAGGVLVGYRQGVAKARLAQRRAVAVPAPVNVVKLPGEDFALVQRPVERPIKLDSAEMVGLFGLPVIVGVPHPTPIGPVRIDYGIPIASDDSNRAGGKFNFNIGYQF